jgi:Abortive infection alpha
MSDGLGRELLRTAPGLARIAAATGLRLAGSAATAYGRAISRFARAAAEQRPGSDTAPARRAAADTSTEALRRRGAELLRRSAELEADDLHPAYMRILEALSPDEGRILRFLALGGPQPAVDVRSGLPLVSQLVSQGHTTIGEEAGCLHGDRIHPYLDNLHRLGLIWFSREPVSEPRRYQVLEAQPDVVEALKRGGRLARTVRRSIMLTPFGQDFGAACLPLDEEDPSAPAERPYSP